MKNKNLNIDKHLEEYKALKELYRDFSVRVKHLLKKSLHKHKFKCQIISCREKSELSLKNTLQNLQSFKSLKDVKDLAGCRVIFYLNDSVERIIQYLRDEFEVVDQKPKYSDDGYQAIHLIVKLKKDRLQLTKYKRFNDLQCEIQLTTVLFHAWSEMAHDIIYKPEKSLPEFDKRAFQSIKNRFSNTMKKHIREAQYDLDFIAKDMDRIKRGKRVFDRSFLDSLSKAETNNEIHEKLCSLSYYIRDFGDKTPRGLNIVKIINDILKKSKKLKKIPRKRLWGGYLGRGYSDVAIVCLNILDYLKFNYPYPKEVFETLSWLSIDKNNNVKTYSLDIASRMTKYRFIPNQKKIYSYSQIILDEIEKCDNKKLLSQLNLITKISEQTLSPDFKGTSWSDYETLVSHHGALPAGKTLKQIRERTIDTLKKLYNLSEILSEKQKILETIKKAIQPSFHNSTSEFDEIILGNTNTLIDFYLSIIKKEEKEIIRTIEAELYRLKKSFPKGLKSLEKLQLIITEDVEYQIYKVLVGWDESLDLKKAEEDRKNKINGYVKTITQKNFIEWRKRILSVVKNYSQFDDKGQYYNFRFFLEELGIQKPQIAEKLISENEEELKLFLINLLSGIWKSSKKESAKKILNKWIKVGKNLPDCGLIFEKVRETDESLLKKVYQKAKEKNDTKSFINIIKSIFKNFESSQIEKNIFVDCFKELETYKNDFEIKSIFYFGDTILEVLTRDDWLVVLKTFLHIPSIDYHLEKTLSIVAEKYPKELINFFFKRVEIQKEKDMLSNYEAIPIQLHHLDEPLNKKAKFVIEEILKWFQKDKTYHSEGGHFLQAIFPGSHEKLEDQLIKMIRSRNQTKGKIVLNILHSYKYKNGTFLHGVCKEVIKQYPKEYEKDMFLVLSQTGNVSGEYGFVEHYERKKQEMQEWKKDKNPNIQNFAINYEKYLFSRITEEQRRADEDIAIEKRKFENQK